MRLYQEHKTYLTPAERLRVAVAVLVDGWDQCRVAALMGVNPGRVNEAVTAIRDVIDKQEGVSGLSVFEAAQRRRQALHEIGTAAVDKALSPGEEDEEPGDGE